MKKVYLLSCVLLTSLLGQSQLLTWSPAFPKDNDNITITVDATKGNQGLLGFSGNVYVHIGLITSASTSSSNWLYSPFTWGTTPAAAQATPAGTNKWSYTINNIRSFFNVPAGETILKIALLFRDGPGNMAQRNSDASDMYVPVYPGAAVRFSTPPFQPKYVPVPEPITKQVGDNISVTGIGTGTTELQLYLNGTMIQNGPGSSISANPVLTTAGNNEIVLKGVVGPSTVNDTLRFFVSSNINIAPLPAGVRNGINYAANNTEATLVLYAPGKTRVSVIGEFAGSNWTEQSQFLMNNTPDGNYWWLKITGLTPGTEYAYQYLVDGTLKIADPYAEKILDPYNNNDQGIPASTYPGLKPYPTGLTTGIVSVLQTNAPTYTWVNNNFARPDKRNLFIYELLVRDFVATHDWKTIKDTLTYLKRLGVNAIEIMPFNEFEGNNSWGYNPDFYFAPDKYYGPKNTLKEFVDACHSNGIAVVMDIALNHSFGLSPLVQLYWDAANNRPAANNPWFNPVPKHAFNVGYDMNHESAATQYYFSRIVEHWLQEYKLDGFRFDLSKGFTQTQTCDASGNNCNVGGWSNYDASRVAIWKKYYDTVQLKSPGAYAILEHFAADNEEIELSNYGMLLWGNMNYNFNEASMGFINTSDISRGLYSVRGWNKPYLVTYMESHDEERMAFKNISFGNSSGAYNIKDTTISLLRNAMSAAFLMSMPGPKMIWQFGELGYDYPINYCENGTINNSCRLDKKPIRWDYKLQARRQKLFDTYSSLAKLRSNGWYKDVFTANNISIDQDLGGAVKTMIVRSANDTSLLVIVGNFDVTGKIAVVTFPKAGTWYDYISGTTIAATGNSQPITLQPGDYHIYLNRNVSNVPVTGNGQGALQLSVYPNPVDNTSVANVTLPENSNVQIDLFNAGGQKVQTIFTGVLAQGKHTITFSAKTYNLPTGIYLLKAQTQTVSQSLKILIK
ncbi:MAG: T9SS type A sorting domain-containing protein [Bacteroidetes bacterium]|nr:MAG: T9SS type A sorting domain-containing protein [Bacteroidota bacterium]